MTGISEIHHKVFIYAHLQFLKVNYQSVFSIPYHCIFSMGTFKEQPIHLYTVSEENGRVYPKSTYLASTSFYNAFENGIAFAPCYMKKCTLRFLLASKTGECNLIQIIRPQCINFPFRVGFFALHSYTLLICLFELM